MSLTRGEEEREYPDGRPEELQPHWRRDFPTDLPEDDLVARREFTKFLVLTSGAFVVGQCWIAGTSLLRRAEEAAPPLELLAEPELRPGLVKEFRYPTRDDPCLLICLADGQPVAYGQKCTHLSCAVVPDLPKGQLHCPCHNGAFEVAEGRPVAGPPRRPLPRVRLERRDGKVFAVGVELRTV
jgi:nitrite reductase/ring-hydroxylating ferredoxin subunit